MTTTAPHFATAPDALAAPARLAAGATDIAQTLTALREAWLNLDAQTPPANALYRAASAWFKTLQAACTGDPLAALDWHRSVHVLGEAEHILNLSRVGGYERPARPHAERIVRLITDHSPVVAEHTYPAATIYPRLGVEIVTAWGRVCNVSCVDCTWRDQHPAGRREAAEWAAAVHARLWAAGLR